MREGGDGRAHKAAEERVIEALAGKDARDADARDVPRQAEARASWTTP
jgi:hypothetical protein